LRVGLGGPDVLTLLPVVTPTNINAVRRDAGTSAGTSPLSSAEGCKADQPRKKEILMLSDRSAQVIRDTLPAVGAATREQYAILHEHLVAALPGAALRHWYDLGVRPATTDTMQGVIELEKVEVLLDSQAYLCGPLPFMDSSARNSWRGGFPKPTSTARSSGRTCGSPASDS
jgi:hypothetical protein